MYQNVDYSHKDYCIRRAMNIIRWMRIFNTDRQWKIIWHPTNRHTHIYMSLLSSLLWLLWWKSYIVSFFYFNSRIIYLSNIILQSSEWWLIFSFIVQQVLRKLRYFMHCGEGSKLYKGTFSNTKNHKKGKIIYRDCRTEITRINQTKVIH